MYRLLAMGAFFLAASAVTTVPVWSEETRVDVRVMSKGGKFIGTSMGGVEVILRDAQSREILARGKTSGSTGDTKKIMKQPLPHHAPVSTDDAAVFRASIDLEEPRRIKVCARGPLAQPQAAETTHVTQWVVPGRDIVGGDALTLKLPGFVVDILDPPAHQMLSEAGKTIDVQANVTMMCGCPIEPGGLWDADQFEVAAIVKLDGEKIDHVPLRYAGTTSQFAAEYRLAESGAYEITVYAYDPKNGNTGVDKTSIVVVQ